MRKEAATKQVEHDRYLKALRALIADKGSSNWGGTEQSTEWRDKFFEDMELQM